MIKVTHRILGASVALALLGLAGGWLLFAPRPRTEGMAGTAASAAPEAVRFTAVQRATADFLDQGRVAAGTGRGLFETDFFKPPPVAPSKPKPPAPTTREVVVFYRGLAAFPGGARVAYVALEGRLLTLAAGEGVTDGWTLADFDAERAVLAKGERTVTLAFNRRAVLSVPVKP